MPDNNSFSLDSNIVKYNLSCNFYDFTTKLLQELYVILLNIDIKHDIEIQLNEFMSNYLFEYDLDPKDLLDIMTSNSHNIFCYSSLIGFFYQHGIGCEIDKTKASEVFFNTIKDNSNQFSLDQINEGITFYDYDDVKKLNNIISRYFYSLFLYKDVIVHRKNNYKLNIRNAEKGDNVSQYYIGNCYRYGINIKHDYNKAIEWYSKSSSEGRNIRAFYSLGYCHDDKDKKKAFELYLKSAKGGYKHALHMVGNYYYYGTYENGILEDKSKAFEWYLKAAKKGHTFSQYLVANYYNDGKYIPKNEEKGFYWNRKAAINGYTDAQYNLAKYYCDNSINKNERKAFIWYLKLANKNSLRAIYIIAKCYRDGICGIDKNLKEATKWFNQFLKFYKNSPITLNDFLNGSNINTFKLRDLNLKSLIF
jgi:TPR repeat protein